MTREYTDLVPLTTFDRTRESPFSYVCRACSKCCYGKVIRVGPYEALRLSRKLGISTTELLRDHTEAGGTVLRTREDKSCVFLGEQGCTVHPDRPLACRIYPLGWYITAEGAESFGLVEGHPESAGELGTAGTVDDYCKSQELAPYIAMARRYIAAHDRLLEALERQREAEAAPTPELLATRDEIDHLDAGAVATPWLDVDAVVREYCKKHQRDVPTEIDALVDLHLAALDEWADDPTA